MKVVALVSGGKDSCFAMMKCIQYGHQIVALANLLPADDSVDELDSYMYQTVGHQIIVSYAECMGVPLFRKRIRGSTRHQNLNYKMTPGDEVEDMYILLKEVKKQIPSITAVSSGAIASDYQRLRVESVCSRLGLISLAYLWKQDQSLLLQEMITNGIVAITVKVATLGLDPAKHLGKDLASLQSYLHKLKDLYGINVCGEGGEYETLTLDCPLFANARIVLDEFQTVLHSSDPIASVGVLHPLAFHLESKEGSSLLTSYDKMGSVFEVQDDSIRESETACLPVTEAPDLPEVVHDRLRICESKKDNTISISCWLQDSCKSSSALQEDLEVVLKHIESQLAGHGVHWQHVLYIHLYIADMNEFTRANETYVKYITQDKCPFGVPSRSTIELPLLQAGLGKAYIEVLVANNQSKNVLHVQSISAWAPSCIGPYSQATLHNEVLYMAGQLGLDPPKMTICNGGPAAEMEQALKNSEAVAKCFKCSISTSTILFVVYCSTRIPLSDRPRIQDKQELFLDKIKQEEKGSESVVVNPIYLYVLVPDLPKRAFVEVKPVIFISKDAETEDIAVKNLSSDGVSNLWGFHDSHWHGSCIQKCVVPGKLCTVVLSITNEVIPKICSNFQDGDENHQDHPSFLTEEHLERISKFCIYLLDKVIMENGFCWKDTMNWRIYFPTSLNINLETLSLIFANSCNELVEKVQRIQSDMVPVFNLVPVVGAGKTATSMDDIVTCELFARKS